jgi:4-hydroxybenzoate polyprenyltransferase
VLFSGVIFSLHVQDLTLLVRSVVGFVLFSLLSSAVYCFNDVADVEKDRLHPEKRLRPLPSGRLSVHAVVWIGLVLVAVSFAGAFLMARRFFVVAVVYFLMNVAYSFRLKHVAILDLILLSAGFVLRAVAGVEVLGRSDIVLSPWLILCTFFLALFIGAGKRRAELDLLASNAGGHRGALAEYSLAFLDRILTTMATASIIGYAIYTLAPGTQEKFHTHYLVYTVPFVVFGLFRYLFLVYERGAGGNPTEAILQDRSLLLDVLLWVLAVVYILYVR